jgi:GT2 family glycosyltransferase
MENINISGSIVVYKEKIEILQRSIESFLGLKYNKELVIIDNSPTNKLENFCKNLKNVKYIHLKKNVGFGKGHNIAYKNLKIKSDIHLIINPDVYFDSKEMNEFLYWFMFSSNVIAIPKVLYPDGKEQLVVRNVPTFLSLVKRKIFKNYDNIKVESNKIINIPFAHGCFIAIKSNIFEKLKGFDERFFMYMEDVDLWIRAKKYGNTVINTNYKIYHHFRKGSSKNFKLFIYHLISAIKFFYKYKDML